MSWLVILSHLSAPYAGATDELLASVAGAIKVQHTRTASPAQPATAPVSVPQTNAPTIGFSEEPKDEEFLQFSGLPEGLVPAAKPSQIQENQSLARAVKQFRQRQRRDDLSAFVEFLREYPDSTWRISLLVNMGLIYRGAGYFTRAIQMWEEAWRIGKSEQERRLCNIVDLGVGELVELTARLGRYDRLQILFSQIKNRPLQGRATECVMGAKEGAWNMKNNPQQSFLCGPLALGRVYAHLNLGKAVPAEIKCATSTPNGTSLAEVQALAKRVGLDYQMAYRSAGAKVFCPSVVHWKSGHFAAIIEERNGEFLVKDPTFGGGLWMTPTALEDETSGHFLIPAGSLPAGWQKLSFEEASNVWGKGACQAGDRRETRPCDKKIAGSCANCGRGMASYSVHALLVSLNLVDTPVSFTPTRGPALEFTATYNQREAGQPANLSYANLGPKWSFGLVAYITDQDTTLEPRAFPVAHYNTPGGGYETYFPTEVVEVPPSSPIHYTTQQKSRSTLLQLSAPNTPGVNVTGSKFELTFADGSKEIFDRSNNNMNDSSRRFYRTKSIDAQGNELTYSYNTNLRLDSVANQLGDSMALTYVGNTVGTPNYWKVKQVVITTSAGGTRSASFEYTSDGRLARITDAVGMTSEFAYEGQSDFINAMTTPYGTTTFSKQTDDGEFADRWLTVTDPLGQQERYLYKIQISSDAVPDRNDPAPTGMNLTVGNLFYRNTFFWDKKAIESMTGFDTANPDYSKARIYHWLHANADLNPPIQVGGVSYLIAAGLLESEKMPLERRLWYRYPGQPANDSTASPTSVDAVGLPSIVGRVLDDGTTQLYKYEYNALGYITSFTDPKNRVTTFSYEANGIDLSEVRQTTGGVNELLTKFTYYTTGPKAGKHLISDATDASGQMTHFDYTDFGLLLSIRDAKLETTAFNYDPTTSFLQSIVVPDVAGGNLTEALRTTSFLPDNFKRIRTVTDGEGFAVTYDYDALDRITKLTYPDNTTEEFLYNKMEPTLIKDRLGRWSLSTYDTLGRLVMNRDSLGRVTELDWCSCGALSSMIDALGQSTIWERDLQGRVTAKIYADGTKRTYTYETNTSRILSIRDAKGQSTRYSYDIDNNLLTVGYSNSVVSTPSVSFTYDTKYNRIATTRDGIGLTTYTYNPVPSSAPNPAITGAGRVSAIDGPLPVDTISVTYDEIGRVITRSIGTIAASVTFDELGRIRTVNNALGAFSYSYENASSRLSGISYPNGQVTVFTNFPAGNAQNRERLKSITHRRSDGTMISHFDHDYDAEGRVKTIIQQADANSPTFNAYAFDNADQLVTAGVTNGTPSSPTTFIKQFAFSYDGAANRATDHFTNAAAVSASYTYLYNNLNQLTKRTGGERIFFKGKVSDNATAITPRSVTVGGTPAAITGASSPWTFEQSTTVSVDSPVIPIVAVDGNGNSVTNKFQISNISASGVNKTLTYDLSGNLISCVEGNISDTFEWDAEDRLAAMERVTSGTRTSRSEFSYDAFGRRVRIIEKDGAGAVTSDKRFVWCGGELCQELNGSGSLTKQYFSQGMKVGATKYFYTQDHLGSIREVVDNGGVVRARYDFDPYGKRGANQITVNPVEADFAFTGHYYHQASGLLLTLFRAYDPDTGRWLSRDAIGEAGGINLYAYVLNNPVNLTDPFGLHWTDYIPDWLVSDGVVNFSAGMGDIVSFGTTEKVRQLLHYDDAVNKCSQAYRYGEYAGIAHGLLMGGAGAAKAIPGPGAGRVFSHWIPDRFFRKYLPSLRNNFGRSRFNGNYVSPERHYLHDLHATVDGWTRSTPGKFNFLRAQLDRIPGTLIGTLGLTEAVLGTRDAVDKRCACDD